MDQLTDKDRAEAAKLFADAEDTMQRAPWSRFVLRPLVRLIRWIIHEMDEAAK